MISVRAVEPDMYVCMHVCMHVCIHTHIYVCIHTHVVAVEPDIPYTCIYVFMYVYILHRLSNQTYYIHVCMYLSMYTYYIDSYHRPIKPDIPYTCMYVFMVFACSVAPNFVV